MATQHNPPGLAPADRYRVGARQHLDPTADRYSANTMAIDNTPTASGSPRREQLSTEALRWCEHVLTLELFGQTVPRRTGHVASALAFLDRELPMSSREIARFARTGHETVRRSADALEAIGLIDRHRRPIYHARADT